MAQSLFVQQAASHLPSGRAAVQLAFHQFPRAVATTVDRQCGPHTTRDGIRCASTSTQGSSTNLDCSTSSHELHLSQHHWRNPPNSGTYPIHQQKSFSTAAEVDEPTAVVSKSKRSRQKKDPITITPRAAERVFELLSSPNAEGALGIRLGVKRRGCNGLSYTLNYAFEREKGEEEMTSHGLTIFVEPMAVFSIVGTVMDWEETDLSSEFTFINPNSKGECGCGESFNV